MAAILSRPPICTYMIKLKRGRITWYPFHWHRLAHNYDPMNRQLLLLWFYFRKQKMYWPFLFFLNTEMAQVVEILTEGKGQLILHTPCFDTGCMLVQEINTSATRVLSQWSRNIPDKDVCARITGCLCMLKKFHLISEQVMMQLKQCWVNHVIRLPDCNDQDHFQCDVSWIFFRIWVSCGINVCSTYNQIFGILHLGQNMYV